MIIGVAFKFPNGKIYSLPKPKRHHDIIWDLRRQGVEKKEISQATQGFINDKNEFLDRKEAIKYLKKVGQKIIKRGKGGEELGLTDKPNWPPNLYSEDLW